MENIIALIVATLVLVSIPGPNVALIVANSLRDGLRAGFITVFGTTLGVAVQLALLVLGMSALIEIAADLLQWIKWGGVAYLIYLGVQTWRSPADDLAKVQASRAIFWRAWCWPVSDWRCRDVIYRSAVGARHAGDQCRRSPAWRAPTAGSYTQLS